MSQAGAELADAKRRLSVAFYCLAGAMDAVPLQVQQLSASNWDGVASSHSVASALFLLLPLLPLDARARASRACAAPGAQRRHTLNCGTS